MRKILIASAVLIALGQAHAESSDDALIERLETSGALDKAVERSFERIVRKQQEAQIAARQEAMRRASEQARHARKVETRRDHVRGNADAELSLIVYGDYECPYCKNFHPVTTEVLKKFGNNVSLVWRHFPLDFHGEAAAIEAEAAECAGKVGGNEAFWTITDAIIANTEANGRGLAKDGNHRAAMAKLAALTLDGSAFEKCMEGHEAAPLVAEDVDDAVKAGIQGTPGVLLRNNRTGETTALPGAVSAAVLESAIRQKVAKN